MSESEIQTVPYDKERWGRGPWDSEPDRVEWRYRGLPCLIVRNCMGALCGYAAVPPGHPWHGKDYNDVEADAHGGLTYASACGGPICHVPEPGEPADVWWLGFDCAHGGDLIPSMAGDWYIEKIKKPVAERMGHVWSPDYDERLFGKDHYKNLAWVRAEVECLADQAIAAADLELARRRLEGN